jgi:hypothetical protein
MVKEWRARSCGNLALLSLSFSCFFQLPIPGLTNKASRPTCGNACYHARFLLIFEKTTQAWYDSEGQTRSLPVWRDGFCRAEFDLCTAFFQQTKYTPKTEIWRR